MINILSYIGMSLQSEACLWTLLGLIRTIFDATLFKVNANLKQVWQMQMPLELSLHVQRFLRTMISGLMLVQCFTVYVYLASYIVLLYPVFLEERPTLVLPWLLLAAIRNLLCELTSLALGLGTCVLLGPARPSCIKFVIMKLVSIMPAFYMWKLIFGYYHFLKVASAFKTFPAVLPSKDLDYGLELAVRRRRTKTLLDEDQVRKKLMASLYCEHTSVSESTSPVVKIDGMYKNSSNSSSEDVRSIADIYTMPLVSNKTISDIGRYEDWFGSEVIVPRDTDRILEQIVLMLLRIGVFLKRSNGDAVKFLHSNSHRDLPQPNKIECINTEVAETPPLVASSKGRIASYLRDYPQIFMKKPSGLMGQLSNVHEPMPNMDVVESNQSAHSVETNEVSLESVPLLSENKIEIYSKKEMSKSHGKNLIHSFDDIIKYERDTKIEKLNIRSPDTTSLEDKSLDSIQSIINRMKMRAACTETTTDNKNREVSNRKKKTNNQNK